MKITIDGEILSSGILFSGKRKDNECVVFGNYYHQTEFYGDECDKHFIITSSEDLSYDQAIEYHEIEFESLKIIIS
jgi:hypothetical protein